MGAINSYCRKMFPYSQCCTKVFCQRRPKNVQHPLKTVANLKLG